MAAIDEHSLAVIRCLAENKIQDAKKYAVLACINDKITPRANSEPTKSSGNSVTCET